MKSYFSTFITGFGEVIEQALKATLKNVEVKMLADGLVVYSTDSSLEEIKKLKFFNNSFILLKHLENLDPNLPNPFVKQIIRDENLPGILSNNLPSGKATFRVIVSKENEFVKMHSEILKKVEDRLMQITRWQVSRSAPDHEFWFLLRREGTGLFGLRITKRPNYEKMLEKGELYPELAYLLCLMSEPSKDDVFFDPFAGHGSIPAQRLNFPHQQIIAGEIDRSLQLKLKNKFGNKIKVDPVNALSLSTFADRSIDKIVTDPPWGLHSGVDLNLPEFYFTMLKEFNRVLKKDGLLVILVGKKELFEEVLKKFNEFLLLSKYTTLVSGQKASVYKVRKIG